MSLVSTLHCMIQLRRFFENLRKEHFYEALEGISELGLIPFSQEEINEKESKYKDVAPIVRKQFPALLSGVVRCLYGLHHHVKSRPADRAAGKKELQSKARIVFIFSGLTNMPLSTREDIKNLRNHMI